MSTMTRKPASDKGNTRIHLFDLSELNVFLCFETIICFGSESSLYSRSDVYVVKKIKSYHACMDDIYMSFCIHHFVFILARVIYTLV